MNTAPPEMTQSQALLPVGGMFVIPAKIMKAVVTKHGIQNLHNYGVIRQVASRDDVAGMMALAGVVRSEKDHLWFDNPFEPHGKNCFRVDMGKWRQSNTITPLVPEEYITELDLTIPQMLTDAMIQQHLSPYYKVEDIPGFERKGDDALECQEQSDTYSAVTRKEVVQKLYQVVVYNASLYLVVEEGFLSQIKDPAMWLALMTDLVKSAYSVWPVSVVNTQMLYRNYVSALAA